MLYQIVNEVIYYLPKKINGRTTLYIQVPTYILMKLLCHTNKNTYTSPDFYISFLYRLLLFFPSAKLLTATVRIFELKDFPFNRGDKNGKCIKWFHTPSPHQTTACVYKYVCRNLSSSFLLKRRRYLTMPPTPSKSWQLYAWQITQTRNASELSSHRALPYPITRHPKTGWSSKCAGSSSHLSLFHAFSQGFAFFLEAFATLLWRPVSVSLQIACSPSSNH